MNLEVQVRPGRVAGAADPPDELPGRHGAAGAHERRQVAVPRLGAVLVPDHDLAAVGPVPGRRDDRAGTDAGDGGAGGRREVQPGVPVGPEAAAVTEERGQPGAPTTGSTQRGWAAARAAAAFLRWASAFALRSASAAALRAASAFALRAALARACAAASSSARTTICSSMASAASTASTRISKRARDRVLSCAHRATGATASATASATGSETPRTWWTSCARSTSFEASCLGEAANPTTPLARARTPAAAVSRLTPLLRERRSG